MKSRRTFLQFAGAATAVSAFSRIAAAQAYPSRPITIIDPYPAGSPTDAAARILAEPMRKSLAQPILIENVGGAEGNIGTGRAARARRWLHDYHRHHIHARAERSFLLASIRRFERFCTYLAAGHGSIYSLCKENDDGKGAERTHRVAESQSQQGVGGNWRINYPPPGSVLSKRNWDAICFRALSWRSPSSAGLDGRSDRLFVPHTGFPAASASREHEGLCGDTRHSFGVGESEYFGLYLRIATLLRQQIR